MSKGRSEKLLATLPDNVVDIGRIDKRTRVGRAYAEFEGELLADAGGEDISHAKRSLVRRAAFLELLIGSQESEFLLGRPLDLGGHTQMVNSLLGVYRQLGIERKPKRVPTLAEYMKQNSQPSPFVPRPAAKPESEAERII